MKPRGQNTKLVRIRAMDSGDRADMRTFVDQALSGDPDTRAWLPDPDRWLLPGSVVARAGNDGMSVGALAVWRNAVHPGPRYAAAWVLPGWRRLGIAAALWAHARAWARKEEEEEEGPEPKPWQTGCFDSSTACVRFWQRQGFRVFRRTYRPFLDFADLASADGPDAGWRAAAGAGPGSDPGIRIVPVSDASQGADDWVRFAVGLYRDTHRENPPADLVPDAWERLLRRGLLAGVSCLLQVHGRTAGIALLYESEEPGGAELGWCGVRVCGSGEDGGPMKDIRSRGVSVLDDCGRMLLVALASEVFARARARGIRSVRIEADTTDPWATAVLEAFPFGPSATWLSLTGPEP